MKKTSLVAAAISACALSFQGLATAAVENGGAPNLEMSFGLGAMELDKDRTGIDDTGVGLNLGIRFGAETLPIGAEWRLYGGAFALDDMEYAVPYGNRQVNVYCEDCTYSLAGTDFSILLNINRNGPVNPYLGVGFLYEQVTAEADLRLGRTNYALDPYGWYNRYAYHAEWDDDGVTFLFRAGLDLRFDFFYARFDANYIGEIYDQDDKGQVLLSGDVGFHFTPRFRVDLFGHYFTEYKSFNVGIGATVTL